MERTVDSGSVSAVEEVEVFGRMMTLGPKARNSLLMRRLASIWRFRRAAVMAAPEPRARRITKRRPGLAIKRRRRMRQNILRLFRRRGFIGGGPVEVVPGRGAAMQRPYN